jgi:hypothetical protein
MGSHDTLHAKSTIATLACLLFGACQGDYPLAPSLCDDLCHAEDNVRCGDWLSDPAECVVQCEVLHQSSGHACDAEIRELLACLNALPDGNDYCYAQPCSDQYSAMWLCQPGPSE